MKRFATPFLYTIVICIFLTGCALFRSKKEGSGGTGAGAGTGGGGGSNAVAIDTNVLAAASNSPVATITAGNGGTISTTSSDGKITLTASGASSLGGGVSGLSGTDTGEGTSASHGPLKYVFILFGAAIVIWIVWAIVHAFRTRREENDYDDDYYYRPYRPRQRHHRHRGRRHREHYHGHP